MYLMMKYMNLIKHIMIVLTMVLPLASCAATPGNKYPLDAAYLRPEALDREMLALAQDPSGITKLHLLGFSSTYDLPIRALEIGNPQANRNVLIIGQHHGDEVIGVQIAIEFARQLVSQSQRQSGTSNLLSQFRFWIVPTINPEGYQEVCSGVYQWKRKNSTDTDHNGFYDVRVDGVDLNRNYPIFWKLDPVIQPDNLNYKGSSPASEREIQAIINLADKVQMEYAIFFHSSSTGIHSEKIFLPWHDVKDSKQAMEMEQIRRFADHYADLVPKDYKSGKYDVRSSYLSQVGNARNYFFHRYGTQAILVETGGINRGGVCVVHPDKKMLQAVVDKNVNALLKTFKASLNVAAE
jgi:hypothetical protein